MFFFFHEPLIKCTHKYWPWIWFFLSFAFIAFIIYCETAAELETLEMNISFATVIVIELAENCLRFYCLCLWSHLCVMCEFCDGSKVCNYVTCGCKACDFGIGFENCIVFVSLAHCCSTNAKFDKMFLILAVCSLLLASNF